MCIIDKFSKEELEEIVRNSFSYAEVLSKIGYSTTGGNNHLTLKKRLKHFNISTEHFSIVQVRRDITEEEIFCENSKISQNKLRKTFKEKEFVPYKCSICGQEPFWNGKPLVLTLDHKNGKNKDNRIKNLRWVCPNCDRQLDTYGAKNQKKLQKEIILHPGNYNHNLIKNTKKEAQKGYCINCGRKITQQAERCVECSILARRKTKRPSKEKIEEQLKNNSGNFSKIASFYNVTDNTVRKWCKGYGLPYHTSDYKT